MAQAKGLGSNSTAFDELFHLLESPLAIIEANRTLPSPSSLDCSVDHSGATTIALMRP